MRLSAVLGLIVVLWLAAGALAAGQRGYYNAPPAQCSQAATVAATIAVGPLNYLGLNPKLGCELPQPSSAPG